MSMIRKLILPALAAAMLAGCATYQYRGGAGGDYYYGQPTTEYRYYGNPYGSYGYGYPYGWGGSIGYSYGYYPHRYYRYGGYPRYPHRPGHDGHGDDPGSNPTPGQQPDRRVHRQPGWRDLGRLRDRAGDGARVENERQSAPAVRSRPVAPMQRSAPTIRTAPKQPYTKRDRDLVPTP
jgi:hypothetical protein